MPFLSLPCHVRMNMFRLSSTSLLTSKIDNLCIFHQLLSKSLLLLCLLIALSDKINMFCCCSRMSLTRVLNFGQLLATCFGTKSCITRASRALLVKTFSLVAHTISHGHVHPNHDQVMFLPSLIEHIEIVVVQLEQKYMIHYLPTRTSIGLSSPPRN